MLDKFQLREKMCTQKTKNLVFIILSCCVLIHFKVNESMYEKYLTTSKHVCKKLLFNIKECKVLWEIHSAFPGQGSLDEYIHFFPSLLTTERKQKNMFYFIMSRNRLIFSFRNFLIQKMKTSWFLIVQFLINKMSF